MKLQRFALTIGCAVLLAVGGAGGYAIGHHKAESTDRPVDIARRVAASESMRNVSCGHDESTDTWQCTGTKTSNGCDKSVIYDDGSITEAKNAPMTLPDIGC